MRIERVVARAFGPFRGEELQLSPGMTVVSGPNEAGKSSWHAAMRMALTVLRRGKGPGSAAERTLAERHRPWDDPDRWAVEARVRLADGRLIEVSQDLAGKVDCRAVDVGLGRDVSHEIMDGTPDASRWLGLNRDAFAATVSVSQAQIMAVADSADELQEQMQRAAATRGTDATAAEAISRLEQFRKDAVGIDRVGARGPLRTAKDRLALLEARLADARRQHAEYLDRAAHIDVAEARVGQARRATLRAEAHLAAARADASRRRFETASELAARHPSPPEASEARDERADAAASALDGWAARTEPVVLPGPTAVELEAELATLPEPPAGDHQPHESVRAALHELDLAEHAITLIEEAPAAQIADLPAVDESRVRDLARRLRIPQLPGVGQLEEELAAAELAATGARRSLLIPVAAAVALLAGIVAFALGQPAVGLLLGTGAVAGGALAWRSAAPSRSAARRVARAQAALVPFRAAHAAAEQERQRAAAEARAASLPVDSASLDELADRLASAAAVRQAGVAREVRITELTGRQAAAGAELIAAIRARGMDGGDDPRAAWLAYEAACRSVAAQAAAASRRDGLASQLEARRAAERSAAVTAAAVRAAEERLRAAATANGLDATGDPERLVAALRAWQQPRAERVRRSEAAVAEWQRLQALLDGRALQDLEDAATADAGAAAQLATELGDAVDAPRQPVTELEAAVARLREELLAEASRTDALRGNLEARRDALPGVSEAEESVLATRAELARVETLADTLDRTLTLLRSAEERVHRSLAPVLAAAIARWLPVVCQGAYEEVSVDPADLSVTVKEAATGKWREARLLSEGTREQVYLLLRVAMAEHLVTNGEQAPLLLDEVTVQSDQVRKAQLLDVLHRISAERQVVLFTHDDDVLAWAQRRLDGERDSVVLLPARRPAGVPAPGADAGLAAGLEVAAAD